VRNLDRDDAAEALANLVEKVLSDMLGKIGEVN